MGNGVPDYYPTLYPRRSVRVINGAPRTPPSIVTRYNPMPFPYIYPGAYSQPAPGGLPSRAGFIVSIRPSVPPTRRPCNQAPLDSGDSLVSPGARLDVVGIPDVAGHHVTELDRSQPQGRYAGRSQSLGLQPFLPTGPPRRRATTSFRRSTQPFNAGAGSAGFSSQSPEAPSGKTTWS